MKMEYMFSLFTFILIWVTSNIVENVYRTSISPHCGQYATVAIDLAVFSPGIGIVVFFENKCYVLSSPKSVHNYPRLAQVNDVIYANMTYYPFNAIINLMDENSDKHEWIAVRQTSYYNATSKQNEFNSSFYRFESLNTFPVEIENTTTNTRLMFLTTSDRTARIVSAFRLPTYRDYYSGIFYKTPNHNTTKMEFRVSGYVFVSNESIDFGNDSRWNAIDVFWNKSDGESFGYRSLGRFFQYFHSPPEQISIAGISPFFDNQVLIGCPLTLCVYAEFDAATRTADTAIYIFYGNYFWTMNKLLTKFDDLYPNALTSISTISLNHNINQEIVSAFTFENKTHLFTRGNKVWISEGHFQSFAVNDLLTVLPNFGEQMEAKAFDAMFTKSNLLFIITGNNYYVYDLLRKQLSDDYLEMYNFDPKKYPRTIADFHGVPENIDSAFSFDENVVYIFSGTFLYKLSSNRSPAPQYRVDLLIIQHDFIDCQDYKYEHTEYKNFTNFIKHIRKFLPKEFNSEEWSFTKRVLFILLVSVLTAGLGILCLLIAAQFMQNYNKTNYRKQNIRKIRRVTRAN